MCNGKIFKSRSAASHLFCQLPVPTSLKKTSANSLGSKLQNSMLCAYMCGYYILKSTLLRHY